MQEEKLIHTKMEGGGGAALEAGGYVCIDNVHDFTGTTQSVEDSHVVTNTRNTYNHSLTDFMLYLFSNSNIKLIGIESLRAA